jgi:fermentation-respiration switch protein FrsA (DUF1100 family)
MKPGVSRVIGWILLVLAVTYLLLVAILALFQDRLVFFPEAKLIATPAAIGLRYEDVTLVAEDGRRLHGWFVPAPGQEPWAPVVLFCHGNAGNISHRLDTLQVMYELGLAVLLFDYRGYGLSEGRPSEAGTYRDARAAWKLLTEERGYAPDEILLWGRSLGGAVVAELATHVAPRAVILESTFTSAVDLGSDVYPWLPVRWLARLNYDTAARVERMTCPKLIVHSREDDVVPFTHAQRLFARSAPPKQLLAIGGSHQDGFLVSAGYRPGVRAFLGEVGALLR